MTFDTLKLDEDGYVILKGVLSKEDLQAFEDEIARLTAVQLEERGIKSSGDVEPLIKLFKIGGKYRHVLYTMLQYLSAINRIKRKVLDLVEPGSVLSPLGFRVPVATNALRIDLPNETEFSEPVHQDYSCYAPPAFHAWVPLRRVDDHFGSMRVWPGTHKHGFVEHNLENPRRPFLEQKNLEGLPNKVVEAEGGDVVLFNVFLFHSSVPNRSNRIKFNGSFLLQDFASLQDPEDPKSSVWKMVQMTTTRQTKIARPPTHNVASAPELDTFETTARRACRDQTYL